MQFPYRQGESRGVGVAEQVQALAEPLAAGCGLVLVDVRFFSERGTPTLRCTVDKAGGVTLDDIEGFHRALDPVLDTADLIAHSYVLEVSSPGAERPLRTPRDFELFAGRDIVLAAREAVGGRREWRGRLCGLDGGRVVMACGPDGSERVEVPMDLVAWARLRLPG